MPAFTHTATEPATPKSTSSGWAHTTRIFSTPAKSSRGIGVDLVGSAMGRSYPWVARRRSGRGADARTGQGVERAENAPFGRRREFPPPDRIGVEGVGFVPQCRFDRTEH